MRALAAAPALLVAGCMVPPDYHRPAAPLALRYKELTGWTAAMPADMAPKGQWWAVFNDPLLGRLEARVAVSNQNVRNYAAQYAEAQAIVQEARAQLFPTLGVGAGVSRESGGGFGSASTLTPATTSTAPSAVGVTTPGTATTTTTTQSAGTGLGRSTSGNAARTIYQLTGMASWDPDLWGRIRRQIESDVAAAQVSAADLANATLSAQASLATDYMDLRYQDSLQDLLSATVTAYAEALRITHDQVEAGTAPPSDEANAETQLETARASLVNVALLRGQYEHAIAVLAGMPPDALSIPRGRLPDAVPVVPAGVPATLLQRRPDVAAAERAMAEANAAIGVQVAAYYPDLTLSADFGWETTALGKLISAASRVWSLGANASETLFEGGARSASVNAARAAYDANVASYRQTALTAIQQVEDELVALHVLQTQARAEDAAVAAALRATRIALDEYQVGTVAYTTVVTAQTAQLANQQTALGVRQQRLAASIALIEALGGGWTEADLPSKESLQTGLPFL